MSLVSQRQKMLMRRTMDFVIATIKIITTQITFLSFVKIHNVIRVCSTNNFGDTLLRNSVYNFTDDVDENIRRK